MSVFNCSRHCFACAGWPCKQRRHSAPIWVYPKCRTPYGGKLRDCASFAAPAFVQSGRLGIVLDNSYSGAITKRDDKYISSKHEGFGFGISSVCAIVKKYGGLADFSADANTFHASIMIPIPVLKEQTDTPCNV